MSLHKKKEFKLIVQYTTDLHSLVTQHYYEQSVIVYKPENTL